MFKYLGSVACVLILTPSVRLVAFQAGTTAVEPITPRAPFTLTVTATSLRPSTDSVRDVAVTLTVQNNTDVELPFPDVHLYAEQLGNELESTLLQRQITHKLHVGDPEIREGGYQPSIAPGKTSTRTFSLKHFYKIKSPGMYRVRMKVAEEATFEEGKWIPSQRIKWVETKMIEVNVE